MKRSLFLLPPFCALALSGLVCSQSAPPLDITQPPPEGRVDEWIEKTLTSSAELGPQEHATIVPHGPDLAMLRREWDRQATSPVVQAVLGGHNYEILRLSGVPRTEKDDPAGRPADAFRVLVHDYTTNQGWLFDSNVGATAPRNIGATDARPSPTSREYAHAAQLIRDTPSFGPALRDGFVRLSRPMPGLVEGSDHRSLLFHVMPNENGRLSGFTRGLVGVDLGAASLLKPDMTTIPVADVTTPLVGMLLQSASTCVGEPVDAIASTSHDGNESLDVTWGQWSFSVVRPSASSPTAADAPHGNGGGVELRHVNWKGRQVLYQAHVPILNVKYDTVTCNNDLSFRDQVDAEATFYTEHTANDGIVQGSAAAQTMWNSPPADDHGDFNGVWMWEGTHTLTLVSTLQAGHYRYLSKWTFYDNGMLTPAFGFKAVENPCTCNPHTHHAYWRLDFDVNGAGGNVIQKTTNNGSTWTLFGNGVEARDYREVYDSRSPSNYTKYYYRVTGASGYKALIKPGIYDQSTRNVSATVKYRQGGYADGDVWGLREKANEMMDPPADNQAPEVRTQAKIQTFVNGESINNTDVVMWYGAHMSHSGSEHSSPSSTVGPTIVASW